MIVFRIFNCAAPLALLSILGYGTVAAAEDPLPINWGDMLLSYRNNGGGGGGRRYLQSSSSCSSDAFNTCMSNALPSSSAVDSCVSCMNAASANAVLTDTDCASANDFFCAAATGCSCTAPCRVQYASLAQCVVEEGDATFTCTINCGSNSGGGSSSSGGSGSSSSSGGGGGSSTSDGGSSTSSGGSGSGSGSPSTSSGSSMTKGPALALAAAALGFSVY